MAGAVENHDQTKPECNIVRRKWQFKTTVHENTSKNMLLGGELWYKLRQAAEIDTDESAKDEGVALSETDYANVSARRYYSTY